MSGLFLIWQMHGAIIQSMKRILYNRATRVLIITNALILLSAAMLGPFYAVFVEKIGGDILEAGTAFGIFAFVAGIATLVSSRFADTVTRDERILSLGYLLVGIGFFAYLFVGSVRELFLVQILIGLGEAIYAPAFDKLFSQHLTIMKMARQWGAWEANYYFMLGLGAVIGGMIINYFGFSVMFIIMGALSLTSSVYLYYLPKEVLKSKVNE